MGTNYGGELDIWPLIHQSAFRQLSQRRTTFMISTSLNVDIDGSTLEFTGFLIWNFKRQADYLFGEEVTTCVYRSMVFMEKRTSLA